MKRGLSLLTSLMMTASVFGGAASQAIGYNSIAVVSAADASPVMNVGNSAFAGTTRVPVGAKKVSIPVKVTSTDLLAMVVKVEVKADKAGAADPVITGFSEGLASVTPDKKASNARSFIWNNGSSIKAPELKDTLITNIEITLPDDAKEDSTYTLTVKSIDPSDLAQSEKYTFDTEKSDLTEKIAFGDQEAEDYTLKFAENANSKWVEAEEIYVEAGATVPVGLEIQSVSNTIGAIIAEYDLTKGAAIEGYEKGKVGDVEADANKTKAIWSISDSFKGYDFKDETHLYTINVSIPKEAKKGDKFTLTMKSEDTSTGGELMSISPVKLPAVDLIVGEKPVEEEKTLDLTIDTVTVDEGTTEVEVPVYAKNGDATAIIANLEAKEGAKITGIKAAAVPGEVIDNAAHSQLIWNNEYSGKLSDYRFAADGDKLFILTVEIPAEPTVDEFPIVFKGDVDISDAAQDTVKANLTDGKIIIKKQPVTTTVVTTITEAPVTTIVTTEAKPVTTTVVTTEAKPAVTTTVVTTEAKPAVTTTIVTTEAKPVVTTSITTEAIDEIGLPTDEDSTLDPLSQFIIKIFTSDYKPEFYYEHEKQFDKMIDDFSATVDVVEKTNASGKLEELGIDVTLTKDCFVFPDAEKYTPHTVYDGTKFKYTVPVTINVDNIKDANIKYQDASKKMTSDVAAKVKAYIKSLNVDVPMPVMIGQLGDFDLSHSVTQTDATYILREVLSLDVEQKSIVDDVVIGDNKAAKDELGDYVHDFALFLGDTDMDGSTKQIDATYILRAVLEKDVSQDIEDKTRIPESIWKSVGVLK